MRRVRENPTQQRDNGIQQAMTESCWRWFLYHLLKLAITSQSVQSVDHISRHARELYPNESRNDAKQHNNNCSSHRRPSAFLEIRSWRTLIRPLFPPCVFFLFLSLLVHPLLLSSSYTFSHSLSLLSALFSVPPFCGTLSLFCSFWTRTRKQVSCLPLCVRSTQTKGQGRQEGQDTERRGEGRSRVYAGRTSVAVAVVLIILVSANDVLPIQDMNPALLSNVRC